jgi:hypothetical protein
VAAQFDGSSARDRNASPPCTRSSESLTQSARWPGSRSGIPPSDPGPSIATT